MNGPHFRRPTKYRFADEDIVNIGVNVSLKIISIRRINTFYSVWKQSAENEEAVPVQYADLNFLAGQLNEFGHNMRLKLAGGKLEVVVSADPDAKPHANGCDSIEFLVSANPGQPLKPIAKVASGGELSRISLAIQVSLAQTGSRCMVFDEVDAGVGGAVAEIVGRELARLGTEAQVLCVTHLAQVAAQAAQQLRVSKLTDGRSTRTSVKALSIDERIVEIARMLGGVDITDRALEHAREMLGVRGAIQSPERTRRGQTSRRQRP